LKPSRPFLLLGSLYLTLVGIDCVWFALDNRPPIWDMAVHLTTALDFYGTLKHSLFSWTTIKSLVLVGRFYPTLFPALMGIFFCLFHPSIHVGPAANIIPLALLIIATYHIGRKLFSENVGILASFLAATYPVMAWLGREALLDFSLVAIVAAAAWAYLCTDNFSRAKASFTYGVLFALGFLTKHGFIFYSAPLALFALYEMATRDEMPLRRRSIRFRNFLAAHVLGTALAAIWYIPHWRDVREYFFLNRQLHYVLGQPEFMTWPSMLYTLDSLARVHMLLVPFLFLLLGLVISLWRFPRRALILYYGGLGSMAIMTLTVVHREVRMSVASLPFLAVLTAAGLLEIRSVRWRRALTAVLVASATMEFVLITFGVRIWPDSVKLFSSRAFEINLYAQSYEGLIGRPKHEDWKIVPILNKVKEDAHRREIPGPRLGIVPDLARFNHFDFILYSKLHLIPVEAERIAELAQLETTARVEYLVIKSGSQGEPGTTRANTRINQWVENNRDQFLKVATFDLPDGSQVFLYWLRPFSSVQR